VRGLDWVEGKEWEQDWEVVQVGVTGPDQDWEGGQEREEERVLGLVLEMGEEQDWVKVMEPDLVKDSEQATVLVPVREEAVELAPEKVQEMVSETEQDLD
jgi:hypothetical protein